MGRIIFDPKAFAPQYVAPRIERGERSKLDPFLTPSGLVATASLVGMLGKLRLPEGLRDAGVDADAAAMKEAAKARAAAKDAIGKQRQIFEKEKQVYLAPDREVLTQAADVPNPAELQQAQLERSRIAANAAFQRGDLETARKILTEAGDRIGLASMQMTSGERRRRQVEKQRQDMDRLGRMVEPRQTAAEQRTNMRRKDFKGLAQEAMAPGATGVSGDQAAAAFNEAIRLAKEERPVQGEAGLSSPNLDVAVGTSLDGKYEFAGMKLEDFQDQEDGTPNPKVKNLTRAQVRDMLIEWKQGGKANALKAAVNTGQDVAEINAFEELLQRELSRKARQEQPRFSVDQPISPLKEDELLEGVGAEASQKFLREQRAKDPYYGMRPEDAILQIYRDASKADTDKKQTAIKDAILLYEPKARTFGDLFVDSRQARVMKHLANLDKIFPDVDEPLSALDQARIKKLEAETKNLEKKFRNLGNAKRQGQLRKALKSTEKDLLKIIQGRNNIDQLRQQVRRIGKFSEEQIMSDQRLINVKIAGDKKPLTESELKVIKAYDAALGRSQRQFADQREDLNVAGAALELGDFDRAARLIKTLLATNDVRNKVDDVAANLNRIQKEIEDAKRGNP